jgi:hypothetical protein
MKSHNYKVAGLLKAPPNFIESMKDPTRYLIKKALWETFGRNENVLSYFNRVVPTKTYKEPVEIDVNWNGFGQFDKFKTEFGEDIARDLYEPNKIYRRVLLRLLNAGIKPVGVDEYLSPFIHISRCYLKCEPDKSPGNGTYAKFLGSPVGPPSIVIYPKTEDFKKIRNEEDLIKYCEKIDGDIYH